MKKSILMSLSVASVLFGADADLGTISVKESMTSEVVENVSGEELKSADLAEALTKNSASVTLVRRSGIANDILIRGQKRDNINVLIDDAKIYGGCPNRMDPPTSHVLTNNIESVSVSEGPYDVENFGTLSGIVKVKTKELKEGISGEINLNAGSFDYRKLSATLSGGNEKIKALISMSTESSGQYEDGNGKTLVEQNEANVAPALIGTNKDATYQTIYKDMDAYEKKTLLTKLYFNISDNQDLKLSYTANRSDDVLYANTGMDALRDDSDIIDIKYSVKDLGSYSKSLDFNYYNSKVEHPMSTLYRDSAVFAMGEMINDMTSKISGLKVKNSFELANGEMLIGIDSSTRSWEGKYYKNSTVYMRDSISKTETDNRAIFAKYTNDYGKLNIDSGIRYDDSSIDNENVTMRDRDYKSFGANVFATYSLNNNMKYFAGIGKASRVPDARELYNIDSAGVTVGNNDLAQTTNSEIDFGFEIKNDEAKLKTKLFYSKLKDYIYYSKTRKTFENVDASIYGLELSGFYYLSDELSFDYSGVYQRGKKDEALNGQTDRDLADIAPLKITLGSTLEIEKHTLNATIVASDSWTNYDSDNGEQKLDGYTILNLKYNNQVTKGFDVTFGVDNVFDKTYAVSNTYSDLTLLSTGTDSMLLNEPGRYIYTNLRYRF